MSGYNDKIKEKFATAVANKMNTKGICLWTKGRLEFFARSRATGKGYRGSNSVLMPFFQEGCGEFATFDAIKNEGGMVKQGEHGVPIIFGAFRIKDEKTGKWRDATYEEKRKDKNVRFILRIMYVYEIGVQTTGIKPKWNVVPQNHVAPARIEDAEVFIKTFAEKTGLKVSVKNGTPCYRPSMHEICIPNIALFDNTKRYYETVFHELTHSTMSAMKREKGATFGDKVYSQEEIVAEVGSVLLSNYFGLIKEDKDMNNSAEYAKHWAQKIVENPNWLYDGMKQAEKAFNYMLEQAGLEIPKEEPAPKEEVA